MKKAILIIILIVSISVQLKAQTTAPSAAPAPQRVQEDTVTLRMPKSKLQQLYGLLGFYTQNIATSRARSVDVEDSKESIKILAPYLDALEADTTKKVKVQVIILPKTHGN